MGLFRSTSAQSAPGKKKAPPSKATKARVRRGAALLSRKKPGSAVEHDVAGRPHSESLVKELVGLGVLGAAVITLLSLVSYSSPVLGSGAATSNWIGPLGARLAGMLLSWFGMTSFAFPAMLLLLSLALLMQRTRRVHLLEGTGFVAVALSLSVLVELAFGAIAYQRVPGLTGGGKVGQGLLAFLEAQISQTGAGVLAVTVLLVGARLGFGVQVTLLARHAIGLLRAVLSLSARTLERIARSGGGSVLAFYGGLREGLHDRWLDWSEERKLRRDEERWEREERLALLEEQLLDEELGLDPEDPFSVSHSLRGEDDRGLLEEEPELEDSGLESIGLGTENRKSRVRRPYSSDSDVQALLDPGSRDRTQELESALESTAVADQEYEEPASFPADGIDLTADVEDAGLEAEAIASERVSSLDESLEPQDTMRGANQRGEVHAELRVKNSRKSSSSEESTPSSELRSDEIQAEQDRSESRPRIHEKLDVAEERIEIERVVSARRVITPIDLPPYELPELGILQQPPEARVAVDEQRLEEKATLLEETLRTFKVEGRVTDILPGPVVTMFEFKPAPGIKVKTIAGLGDDLAMALEADMIRIVAPIPGKGVVGIEVPSDVRETVYLREVMASKAFRKEGMQLPIALGKSIDGAPVCADMAKMPHLLVAGSTGSGKSVCVNSVILSILYRWSPEEVRMILVDPKMLEFSVYKDIPHLLVPVVTSAKKAAMALNWAVSEMYRRNEVLAAMNARNIVNYNERTEGLISEWSEWEASCKAGKPAVPPDCGRAAGLDSVCFRSRGGEPVGPPEKMPYIVIIIDELSDLMMAARKEVEDSIVRLAQMARAAGIHLLLATQRPSTDVVTGLIKANFPGRMSFRVSSMVDSRTVLDANGAEKLLGMGDGLFMPPGSSDLMRFHGAFVTDGETESVVDHIKGQRAPQYVELTLPDDAEGAGEEDEDLDAMYDQAVAVVCQAGKASTSLLQRKLKLGYNRAARIIDSMERQGVIGPADGARPREVFVRDHGA